MASRSELKVKSDAQIVNAHLFDLKVMSSSSNGKPEIPDNDYTDCKLLRRDTIASQTARIQNSVQVLKSSTHTCLTLLNVQQHIGLIRR